MRELWNWLASVLMGLSQFWTWLSTPLESIGVAPLALFGVGGLSVLVMIWIVKLVNPFS